jgi:hypothetical protein
MTSTKRRVDKSQNKRIAKLERQFPTVRQVINNQNSLLFNDTTQSRIYDLLPTALNSEKVDLRGYRMRFLSSKDPPDNSVVRFRYILFLYKCTADYSGAATYDPPLVNDILNDNGDKTLANYNPDNASRIRVLHDRQYVSDQMVTNHVGSISKMYKKSIQFMPLIDKAFVLRPFLLVVSADTTATNKVTLAQDIDLMVSQMP